MEVEQRLWSREGGWQPNFEQPTLGARAQLVLLFGNVDHVRESECFERVRACYPRARVVGCTTAGQIHDARVTDGTITLTAIGFEHTRVALVHARLENVADSFDAGQRLARALDPEGLRHVFVLSEGLKVNASELVLGIDSALPVQVTVSGGCAADGNRLETTHVWGDGPPQEAAVVGLGFYGERLQIGVSAIGGWRPFGPDRLITRAMKNVLYEFDGRPALALYKQYLDKHAEDLPASGLMFPLQLRSDEAGRQVLRALLSVNEAEQSITYAGNVPEGAQARFMFATIDDLIQGTHAAAKTSMQRLGAFSPQLSILVSCNGRRYVLKQRTE
ncbi:MAG TPA: FIST N-terminal domain-containing protein, partial [Polyangiaceae bacterium]|nr:FIST N-terminal domain-containing protein [Polyangiaceae bacterium]